MADSWTITIEQNVRFQAGICPEKCQLDQIENGQLEAIIDFNTWVISGKLCQIARPLLCDEMCGLSEGYALKNVNLIKLKN